MKLHLGCANVNIPGFINVDLDNFPHVHIRADVRSLPMFSDNSADLIYASALFQYFDYHEGIVALKEWSRVLKPGGILRISTIDFDKLLEVYQKTGKNIDSIIGPLYGRMEIDAETGEKCLINHKTVYTQEKLKESITAVGFKSIVPYKWQELVHASHDDQSQAYYPHMEKESGIHIMISWEVIK